MYLHAVDQLENFGCWQAYDKRAAKVPYTLEEYEARKAGDPEFYRTQDSLMYGVAPDIPEVRLSHARDWLERDCGWGSWGTKTRRNSGRDSRRVSSGVPI